MLKRLRTRVIKVFTRSSLAVAAAFGVNAIAFVLLQNQLETSIEQIEAQIAFQSTIKIEARYVKTLQQNYEQCTRDRVSECESLARNLIIRNSRISDLREFFIGQPLELKDDNPIVKNLDSVALAIDTILQQGFQLSIDEASQKGIQTAIDYSKYVSDSTVDISKTISGESIRSAIQIINDNVVFMTAWSEEGIYESSKVKQSIRNIWLCLAVLIAFEIALFILVSASDFWLTNIPPKDRPENRKLFLRTKSALPMMGVVVFSFSSVIVSQQIVAVELERTILEGCRRINRNAIFAINQNVGLDLEKGKLYQSQPQTLPSFCTKFVATNHGKPDQSDTLSKEDSILSNRDIILIQATELGKRQAEKSKYASTLALCLLVVNALTMAFNAVKLDYQNMDVDDP